MGGGQKCSKTQCTVSFGYILSKKRKIGKKGKKERCCQGGLKKGKTNTVRKRGVRGRPRAGPWADFWKERKERKPRKEKKGAPAKAV